jgi:hypothetical protein
VHGSTDYRGEGSGFAAWGQLLIRQPEFSQCFVQHTFEHLMRRLAKNSERPMLHSWAQEFNAGGQQFPDLVRRILLSDVYIGSEVP